jgi:hypothetical protein
LNALRKVEIALEKYKNNGNGKKHDKSEKVQQNAGNPYDTYL